MFYGTYLLDTSVLIDFSKKQKQTRTALFRLINNKEEIGVCAITVAEFYSGIPFEDHATWNKFIKNLNYYDSTVSAAIKAGKYRYEFARKGITLSIADSLIAAVAWENNATILTNNVKDFPMKDVKVLSLQ